jgi:hypothetical protein
MKKVIFIMPLVFLLSCQKDLTAPDKHPEAVSMSQKPVFISEDAHFPVDGQTITNICTAEDMAMTGYIKYSLQVVIVRDSAHYSYKVDYSSIVGTGLTTGNKYQASGHVLENYLGPVTFVSGVYMASPTVDNILNKIQFTTPGGGNNMTQDLMYHLTTNANGTAVIENINWKFASCN